MQRKPAWSRNPINSNLFSKINTMTPASQLPPKKAPPLTPPGLEANVVTGSTKNLIILLLVFFFLIIGILIYGVLFFLPERGDVTQPVSPVTPQTGTSHVIETKKTTQVSLEETEEELTQKKYAQATLKSFLEMRNSFEADNISFWGGQEYENILTLIEEGDARLYKKEYVSSEKTYSDAARQLKDLYDRKSIIFQQAIEDGASQLSEENTELAKDAYEIALAIEPDNEMAQRGLKRTQNLDRVLELFSLGRDYEADGDLVSALSAYEEAHNLDQLFEPAEIGLHRVEDILKSKKLSASLSSFYAALKKSQLDQAEVALQSASAQFPDDPAVIGATKAFRQAKKDKTVENLRIKAEKLSNFEEWKKAFDTYSEVLKIAPLADFAIHGQEVARKNAALSDRLDDFLNNPQQLQNESILQNAEATLKYATSQPGFGPRMSAKITDLEVAIRQAKSRIKLILFSDNMTAVAIYHVGRLGTFYQKELVLRPGQYTITGERPGFRDVRYSITLTHEHPAVEFSIACKEAF